MWVLEGVGRNWAFVCSRTCIFAGIISGKIQYWNLERSRDTHKYSHECDKLVSFGRTTRRYWSLV